MAAAGSGGHVFPALAVAEALVGRGVSRDKIMFFGGDRMEAETVPAAGYPFTKVDIHGLKRSLSLDNLDLPFKIRRARMTIEHTIESQDIQVMAVFGGYVSVPAGLAARKCGIPLIVHEANAVPGMANRLLARKADTIFVAFEPTLDRLPSAIVVGNPLKSTFDTFDRALDQPGARRHYGIPESATVLGVVGGSQGAQALNDITTEIVNRPDRDFVILHLAGVVHAESLTSAASTAEGWHVVAFEDRMERFYAACDVVLARGGSMTVSELHTTATPSVIVPLPAGGGYQRQNATDFVRSGGAVVIEQDNREEIVAKLMKLLTDEGSRIAMHEAATATDHRGAADVIAARLLEAADG